MKTVNFTSKNLMSWLAMAMLCIFATSANAQVCTQNSTTVLDPETCEAVLTLGDLTTGDAAVFYDVVLKEQGEHVLDADVVAPINEGKSIIVSTPGTYKYQVDNESGCWGTFIVEDKSGPVCDASPEDLPNIFVSCTFEGDLADKFKSVGAELFKDCSSMEDESTFYVDQKFSVCPGEEFPTKETAKFAIPAAAEGWSVCQVIVRTHFIADWAGNVSAASANCTQYLYVLRPQITLPEMNITGELSHDDDCKVSFDLPADPYFQDLPTAGFWGTGEIISLESGEHLCKYAYTVEEGEKIYTCTDKDADNTATYKQIRTIAIIDWCTGEKEIHNQLIEVKDTEGPVVTPGDVTVWSNAFDCTFDVRLGASSAWDCVAAEMDGIAAVSVSPEHDGYTGGSFATYQFDPSKGITIPGVPDGAKIQVAITAWDACGNQTVETYEETIKGTDDYAPICVANDELEVSLINIEHDNSSAAGHEVGARVYPEDIDDTSRDNCAIDYMRIRKAEHHGDLKDTEGWGEYVEYSSIDDELALTIAEKCSVEVWVDLLVVDKAGNYSICPSRLILRDNTTPVLGDLEDQYVDCLWEDKAEFGTPSVWGNCLEIEEDTDEVEYHCPTYVDGYKNVIKKITKTWTVTKKTEHGASKQTTSQNIYIYNADDETFVFPYDYKVECSDEGIPAASSLSDILSNRGCSEWVMNVTEKTFLGDEGSCYKIIRNYEFINWCRWDENLTDDNTQVDKDCADHNNDGKLLPEDDDYQVELNYGNYFEGDYSTCDGYDHNGGLLSRGYFNYTQVIKVTDSVDPTGDVEAKVYCDVNIDDCHQGVVEFTVSGDDLCSDASFTDWYVDATSAYGDDVSEKFSRSGYVVSASGLPAGKYELHAKIEDGCNNFIWVTETVTVEEFDCKKPTVIGLANFTALMENCTVDIWLSDILASYDDNCLDAGQYGGLTFGMELANDGVASDDMPTAQVVTIDAAGVNTIALWAMDAAGNTQYTFIPVNAQDNAGNCATIGGADEAAVVGSITNENGEMIDNVVVSAKGSNMVDFTSIFNGSFNVASVPMNSDVTISAEKNVQHLNGVSTADLVLLQRHVLGITPLTSAYSLIAADANNDAGIDTRDMLHISRLILGIYDELPSNNSWRFVDKNHTFANPTSPWGFPEAIDFQSLSADAQADFVGVKVGDLSGNATPSNLLGSDDTKVGAMNIAIEDATIAAGETRTIEFTTANFNNFAGYQFSIALDSRVEFNGVATGELAGVTEANFGLANLESGVITTNWSNVEGVSVENGTVMFSLTVTATQPVNVSEILAVNSAVTTAEAYNNDLDVYTVGVQFNRAANASFELFQNIPNPVSGETVIGFNLPTAGAATLKVMDVAGRTIHTVSNTFAAGFNAISLEKSDLNATGVLYYTLDTENNSATKKMVILE